MTSNTTDRKRRPRAEDGLPQVVMQCIAAGAPPGPVLCACAACMVSPSGNTCRLRCRPSCQAAPSALRHPFRSTRTSLLRRRQRLHQQGQMQLLCRALYKKPERSLRASGASSKWTSPRSSCTGYSTLQQVQLSADRAMHCCHVLSVRLMRRLCQIGSPCACVHSLQQTRPQVQKEPMLAGDDPA